jgi:hypothetical protein
MKPGCGSSNNLVEIDQIYVTGLPLYGWYSKGSLHDYLKSNPGTIQVNIYPYPECVPAVSSNFEKYVKSASDGTTKDNLLSLPRE